MSIWLIGSGAYATIALFGVAMCRVASPAPRDDPDRAGRGVMDTVTDDPHPQLLVAASPAGNVRKQSTLVPSLARSRWPSSTTGS